MSIAANIEFLQRLKKLNGMNPLDGRNWFPQSAPGESSRLTETVEFGPNPGDLRMFSFVPDDHAPASALVVVLHGCTQKAAGYDIGAGWSSLAEHYGFALLMPEQTSSNNPNGCFNWFLAEDTTRGSGEVASIRQMIERMALDHDVDRSRIFITGLSAGGAMTAAMLATYPEVFAAGAVIAGLPYGIASNVREALSGMSQSPDRSASELGDLVRSASPHPGPWPKLSVWHGSADRTVHPGNAEEIVKQWLDLHQLPAAPMAQTVVDGHPRQVWWNADGQTLVESYTITDMSHGTPLGIGDNDERYGAEGAYLIEAGISSSYHIAHFFGLTSQKQPKPAAEKVTNLPERIVSHASKARAAGPRRSETGDSAADRRGIDINAVINRALTAAGLRK